MDDDFWSGKTHALPSGQILYGTLGEENPKRPGVYRFSSTTGIVVNDAHVLSPDSDINGNGESTKPRPGSPCVGVMTNDGSQCFVIGFHRAHRFSEASDKEPDVGNSEGNNSAGDKAYRTEGGATLTLKRGGVVIIEGGVGTSVIMNPINNQVTVRSSNMAHIADGYRSSHGRASPGEVSPKTLHQETFHDRPDAAGTAVVLETGHITADVKRRLVLKDGDTTLLREDYEKDGSWIGEGRQYQYGGREADEPMVLGLQLVEAIHALIDTVASLKVNTAWGPSTTPLPDTQVKLSQLKSELSAKILSTFMFMSKDPSTIE